MARPESRREISDPHALTALAHPVRLALLNHLMAFGPRTASQCAEVVGSTPSNCSYHLRHLARFGLVEPVEAEDGRERPWRAAATGFHFRRSQDRPPGPAARAAEEAMIAAGIEERARLAYALLERADRLDAAWEDVTTFADYALRLNPAELTELVDALDRLIRPFIALTREDAPDDAELVHLSLEAFVHPDTLR